MQAPRDLGERSTSRSVLLAAVVLAALVVRLLPAGGQDQIAWATRSTVLRPFLDLKWKITELSATSREVDDLYATVDSLMEIIAVQDPLVRENATFRQLMALDLPNAEVELVPARFMRPGGQMGESMFLIDRGLDDGVRVGAPVLSVRGLLGRVVQAKVGMASGIDWTHPDFRVSAMVEDGSAFGIVYVDRGSFREADRLVLDGLAYHAERIDGMDVLTSGLGGIFPKGIKIGTVVGIRDERVPWARSYWVEPAVNPASTNRVLVGVSDPARDYSVLWDGAAHDSASRGPAEPMRDSVTGAANPSR